MYSIHRTEDALALYKEIIDGLLEKAKNPLEITILIDSVISYVPIAIYIKPPGDILHIINETIPLADKMENKRARVMLELCLGSLLQKQGKYLEASPYYDRGWNLAQKIEDENLIKNAAKLYALSLFWQGRIKEAIQIYEENLGNIEDISPELRDLWAYLMLAWSYGISGRIGRGLGLVESIRERAVSKGYLKTQAFAHGVIALILLEARMLKEAEPHIKEAVEIGTKINSDLALYIAKPCKAYVEFIKGNLEEAKALLESGLCHKKRLGAEVYSPWFFEMLLASQNTWKTVGEYSFFPLMKSVMNQPNIYNRGSALRYYALSKGIGKGNMEEGERLFIKSQELLQQAGANVELGRTQIELTKLYIEKKDKKKAKEFASLAYRTLSEIDISLFPPQLKFLLEEKSKEVRRDYGVSELESAIHLLPDFDKYLSKVVTILTDMFGAERAAILLIKEESSNEDLHVAASRNFSPEELEFFHNDYLNPLILNALNNSKPLIISDHKNNQILLQLSKKEIHIKSMALIPLLATNRAIGLIYMDNRLLKEISSRQNMTIMSAIATQLSLAFKTSMLSKQLESFKSSFQEISSYSMPNEGIVSTFPQIIGKSKAINDVLYNAKKVAATNATVLIYGETGVGKELIAHILHFLHG